MVRETWVQSQVVSYQKLLKWYLIPPRLTLSNIRYVSRVKWRNPGKGVAPPPTPRCSNYWKRSLLVALDFGRQLYFYIYIYIYMIIIENWKCHKTFFQIGDRWLYMCVSVCKFVIKISILRKNYVCVCVCDVLININIYLNLNLSLSLSLSLCIYIYVLDFF